MVGGPGSDRTFFAEEGTNNCAPDVEFRTGCTSSAAEVHQRDRSRIEVGYLNAPVGGLDWNEIYMVGSEGADIVDVTTSYISLYGWVAFTAEPGSAPFDTSVSASSPNCNYKPTEVKCTLLQHMDAITIAGMGGDDRLNIASNGTEWDNTTTPTILGGQGNDVLIGSGQTEDVLVDGDGPGNDTLQGHGFDDALLNNEGTDNLQAGAGSDLLLSATICDGDILQGAESKKGDKEDANNASWSQLPAGAVVADLQKKTAGGEYVEYFPTIATASTASASAKPNGKGNHGGYSGPACASGALDHLQNIDDLEGSAQGDALYGNAKDNNLLGRLGEDFLYGRAGDDRIAAMDGQRDEIGGGGGEDTCVYDKGLDAVKLCNP
jgi:Ca2+-binding RTX toxin-like protein